MHAPPARRAPPFKFQRTVEWEAPFPVLQFHVINRPEITVAKLGLLALLSARYVFACISYLAAVAG